MLTLETYEKQFATPVLQFSVQDADAMNAGLMAHMQKARVASDGAQKSNRGGWHSEGNLFDSDVDVIAALKDRALDAIRMAHTKIGAKTDFDALNLKISGWINANPKGGFNAPHSHPGAHWSGVYYVAQPSVDTGTSGMIEFIDPRTDLPHWRLLKAPAFRLKRKLRPQPGTMILFPSYLVHWVYPNEAEEERVSIAFNATFSKRKRGQTAAAA